VFGVRAFICSYRWFAKLLVAVIAIPPVTLMILGGRHIAEQWSRFKPNRGTELVVAVVAAVALILFFVVVPTLVREISDFFRRMHNHGPR
jgi:uncharacterized membrane protein